MDHAKSALPSLKTSDDKYDILYLNTPWSALTVDRMEKLPLNDISSDDAALFMWTDSYSVHKTTALLEKWGFKFHSVFQVMDIAQYPWMKKAKENEDDVKKKINKKSRAPPVTSPSWWSPAPEGLVVPSRPTTEQLWLAVKGDPSSIFAGSTTAYNVINLPDVGKKSRSKNKVDSEWELDRPVCFLDTVVQHMGSGVKVLDLFSTTLHDKVDSWGPGLARRIPAWFHKECWNRRGDQQGHAHHEEVAAPVSFSEDPKDACGWVGSDNRLGGQLRAYHQCSHQHESLRAVQLEEGRWAH